MKKGPERAPLLLGRAGLTRGLNVGTIICVKIVFDERKRDGNRAKHGFDFESLTVEWFEAATITAAKLGRYQAIGKLEDATIVVIFRPLGAEALYVISMRRAGKNERKR